MPQEDPALPYSDVLALYYGLMKAGNQNVYLFTIDTKNHTNLLKQEKHATEIAAIQQIFKNFNLPYKHDLLPKVGNVNLAPYQPRDSSHQVAYETLVARERVMQKIGISLTTGILFSTAYIILSYIGIL